ncbi:MAG: hypothetical protein LBL45_05075, partial [Treponema sp.]|nr:hypothetical protein [Treponema sp.]
FFQGIDFFVLVEDCATNSAQICPFVIVQIRVSAQFFHALNMIVNIPCAWLALDLDDHHLVAVFQKSVNFQDNIVFTTASVFLCVLVSSKPISRNFATRLGTAIHSIIPPKRLPNLLICPPVASI